MNTLHSFSRQAAVTLAGAFMLAAFVFGGCRSTQQAADKPADSAQTRRTIEVDSDLEALSPQFAVSQLMGGGYSFSFSVGAGGPGSSPGLAALRRLTAFTVEVFDPTGGRADSLATEEINTSGTMNSETQETSLAAFGGLEWYPKRQPPVGTYGVVTIYTERGICQRTLYLHGQTESFKPRQQPQPPQRKTPTEPLKLELTAEETEGNMEFKLKVTRQAKAPDGEYLPSGELYVFEVVNSSGFGIIWSTSSELAFVDMISKVAPEEIGKSVEYRAIWNGTSGRTKQALPSGSYTVVARIPSQPSPYEVRKEFIWRGR